MKSRQERRELKKNINEYSKLITNLLFYCPFCKEINPKIISINLKNTELLNESLEYINDISEPKITYECSCESQPKEIMISELLSKLSEPSRKSYNNCSNLRDSSIHEIKEIGQYYCITCKEWFCVNCLKDHHDLDHLLINFDDSDFINKLKSKKSNLGKISNQNLFIDIENNKYKSLSQVKFEKIKEIYLKLMKIHNEIKDFNTKRISSSNMYYEKFRDNIVKNIENTNEMNNLIYRFSEFIYLNYKYFSKFEINSIYNYDLILSNFKFFSYSRNLKYGTIFYNFVVSSSNIESELSYALQNHFVKWMVIEYENNVYNANRK